MFLLSYCRCSQQQIRNMSSVRNTGGSRGGRTPPIKPWYPLKASRKKINRVSYFLFYLFNKKNKKKKYIYIVTNAPPPHTLNSVDKHKPATRGCPRTGTVGDNFAASEWILSPSECVVCKNPRTQLTPPTLKEMTRHPWPSSHKL